MYSLTDKPLSVYGLFDKSEPNRIRYVGLTTKGINARFAGHWSQAQNTKRKLPVLLWIRKREKSELGICLIEWADNVEHLKQLEIFHIAQYRELGMADLNLTDGGEALNGRIPSEEWRAKHSARMMGSQNPMHGIKRPEVSQRNSDLKKGWKPPIVWYHNKYHVRGQSVNTMADCPDCIR